jgi:hypothetical protein
MSESSEFDPSEFEKALVIEVIRTVIESAVRYGDIQLEGRTDEAIKKDIHEYIRARLAEPNIFGSPAQYDYQSELINEAGRDERMGDFNLALMFYATWFEHWLNGMFVAREPMVALEREEIIRLIRETDLASKTGHIWQLLFGEKLPGDVVQTILKVAEARNAFVHYSWAPYLSEAEESSERRELQNLARRAAAAVTQLSAIEDKIAFAGSLPRLSRILSEMWPN